MKCPRCRAANPRGGVNCWACGVRLPRHGRPPALRAEAMRYYTASSVAVEPHRAWIDLLVLLCLILFGALLFAFAVDALPARVSRSAAGQSTWSLPFGLRGPFQFIAPPRHELAPVPVGATQDAGGLVVQVVDPQRTREVGGRQAGSGVEFLTVTVVIDSQGKQPVDYRVSDWQALDARRGARTAENLQDAGWLSGGTVEPGQQVRGTVAFLVEEGSPPPQILFAPRALQVVMTWNSPQ